MRILTNLVSAVLLLAGTVADLTSKLFQQSTIDETKYVHRVYICLVQDSLSFCNL